MKKSKFHLMLVTLLVCLGLYQFSNAAPIIISAFDFFPAYPYNTQEYMEDGRFVGCGPTAGAMVLGYFEHVHQLPSPYGLLFFPGENEDEGLNTAWVLHSDDYMDTNADGFTDEVNFKPGLEEYAEDRGYNTKVMIHAPSTYDPDSEAYSDYGEYGDAWINDGIFWEQRHDGKWIIDADLFCDFVDEKLSEGVPMIVNIDTNADHYTDHWVPLIGYDRETHQYAFYDTFSTEIQWADIHYAGTPGNARENALGQVRSIRYSGPLDIIDHFVYGVGEWIDKDYAVSVFIDLDEDGIFDTQVTFVTEAGRAMVQEETLPGKRYFFQYQPYDPDKNIPEERGVFKIFFIDMLAEGWDFNEPMSYTFKRVPYLSVDVHHTYTARPGIPEEAAFLSVKAYSDANDENDIDGFSYYWPEEEYEDSRHIFSHEYGIEMLRVRTDFETNWLNRLILKPALVPPEPNIDVYPTLVNFGTVALESTSDPVDITISNYGTDDLDISNISLSDYQNFNLTGDSTMVIPPGQARTVSVTFSPSSRNGYWSETLTILSNDPDSETVQVTLSGNNLSLPDYQVCESLVDFITPDVSRSYDFVLENAFMKSLLYWEESAMKLSIFAPSGKMYKEVVSSYSPIEIDIENSKAGEWRFEISTLDIAPKNNSFSLIVAEKDKDQFVPANMDIIPESYPNELDYTSVKALSVAVLGTYEFDVSSVDPKTLQLRLANIEDNNYVIPIDWSFKDILTSNKESLQSSSSSCADGYLDLLLIFNTQELIKTLSLEKYAGDTVTLLLSGYLFGDNMSSVKKPIKAEDDIIVLKPDVNIGSKY